MKSNHRFSTAGDKVKNYILIEIKYHSRPALQQLHRHGCPITHRYPNNVGKFLNISNIYSLNCNDCNELYIGQNWTVICPTT